MYGTNGRKSLDFLWRMNFSCIMSLHLLQSLNMKPVFKSSHYVTIIISFELWSPLSWLRNHAKPILIFRDVELFENNSKAYHHSLTIINRFWKKEWSSCYFSWNYFSSPHMLYLMTIFLCPLSNECSLIFLLHKYNVTLDASIDVYYAV